MATMPATISVIIIPAIERPSEAFPRSIALSGSDSATLHATTA